ncbi:hypothetical protein B566_EDAN019283, partial [Ephemera danica]
MIWGIGVSLGGTTGYAINPARDLGPRIAHSILPIAGKGTSDWGYAWIPVLGPICGAIVGGIVAENLKSQPSTPPPGVGGRYIGSIDQGTTSTRFIVFDKQGNQIAVGQKEHTQIYPQAGWVEHDPAEIWKNTQEVIGLALGKANINPSDLA